MIVGAQARGAGVAPARLQARCMEGAHLLGRLRAKAPMPPPIDAGRVRLIDAEVAVSAVASAVARTVADSVRAAVSLFGPQRLHDRVVETLGARQLAHCDREMVEQMHGYRLRSRI